MSAPTWFEYLSAKLCRDYPTTAGIVVEENSEESMAEYIRDALELRRARG